MEVFHYSLGKIRQGWVATANPTFYNSVYQYLGTEATAITSIYLIGIMEYHQVLYEAPLD